MTGLAVGLILVLAGAVVLAVLRPGSRAAAPVASVAPPSTTLPPTTTRPPTTTAPRVTRPPAPLGRVVAQVQMPGGLAPMLPAVGAGSVWALALDAELTAMVDSRSYLARIDPSSNRVTKRIPLPGFQGGVAAIAYGAGSVWIVDSDQSSHDVVSRVDPGRNRVVDRITVGIQPIDIAFAGGAAWVLNSIDETVSRIDPARGQVVATVHLPDVSSPPAAITSSGDALWLPDADLGLVRIDADTNRVTIVPVPGCCSGPITAAGGVIWAADSSSGTLVRFGSVSHELARVRLPDAVDLVTNGDEVVAAGYAQVTWIDRSSNRVTGVLPVNHAHGIAAGAGAVWVADMDSRLLERVAAP